MFKKFTISCNQATTICDKNQYGEATFTDKLKLGIHFLSCKICSLYTKQNGLLTTFYKGYAKSCKDVKHCMPEIEKEQLKQLLEKNK
ncbi:hypothetical protein [Polaribacter tangerinus]|uniref:hypothetical protein n=1 Tax=Polaribacter tangerinus TaxID=1920034 RepID=UPI000B4BBC5E|nr:hypothetical protein [Polaribacter tangerinus]